MRIKCFICKTKNKKWNSACLLFLVHDMEQASFLCLGKLSYSFRSLDSSNRCAVINHCQTLKSLCVFNLFSDLRTKKRAAKFLFINSVVEKLLSLNCTWKLRPTHIRTKQSTSSRYWGQGTARLLPFNAWTCGIKMPAPYYTSFEDWNGRSDIIEFYGLYLWN